MNYELVMFNMSAYREWEQGIANRNRSLFRYFLEQEQIKKIILVDFLPLTLKRALRNYIENILRPTKKGEVIYRDLTTKCVLHKEKGREFYVFSTIDSIFSGRKSFTKEKRFESRTRVIKKINKVFGEKPENPRIIYSCFPLFLDYFNGLESDLTVFDAIDNWLEHSSWRRQREKISQNYQFLSRRSDLIFTVSPNLVDFFQGRGRREDLHWIANGVDTDLFSPEKKSKKNLFPGLPRPIIGYLGTIENRFNLRLFKSWVKKNPKKSFVLVGPVWGKKIKQELKNFSNVYLWGRVPHQQAPAYINSFDLAFIPHKLNRFVRSTYSLKLLEYLACGKPVLTTPTPETSEFQDLIYLASKPQEFQEKMLLALKENDPALVLARRDRVKEKSWLAQGNKMMQIIEKKIK
ncbi:glycosyltransferase [Patescibacteria group bacterium]|nr:glycosyltransferase [Patescibacteria group bacterium]